MMMMNMKSLTRLHQLFLVIALHTVVSSYLANRSLTKMDEYLSNKIGVHVV